MTTRTPLYPTVVLFLVMTPTLLAADAPPAPDAMLYTGPETLFTGNFNFFDIKDGTGPAEWRRWARLRARDGLHPLLELLAIGDGLPAAALKLLEGARAPVSSLNWQINFVTAQPTTDDGWWLLHAITDVAEGGYSSQRMTLWNSRGELIAEATQAVAVFA